MRLFFAATKFVAFTLPVALVLAGVSAHAEDKTKTTPDNDLYRSNRHGLRRGKSRI